MSGDHNMHQKPRSYLDDFECPRCGHCCKAEWVGLTDEEVSEIIDREIGFNSCWGPEEAFARAVESKLREKNHG